jgi:hypothetical protein
MAKVVFAVSHEEIKGIVDVAISDLLNSADAKKETKDGIYYEWESVDWANEFDPLNDWMIKMDEDNYKQLPPYRFVQIDDVEVSDYGNDNHFEIIPIIKIQY